MDGPLVQAVIAADAQLAGAPRVEMKEELAGEGVRTAGDRAASG